MKLTQMLLFGLMFVVGQDCLNAAESLDEQLDRISARFASRVAGLLDSRDASVLKLNVVENDDAVEAGKKLNDGLTRELKQRKIRLDSGAQHHLSGETRIVIDGNRSVVSVKCVLTGARGVEVAVFRERFIAVD
ncbi:hypothetical protein Mal4_10400 [Maioricimonas rarisocia]|uniref:Uncharacterized protein n=1 Tax=Maioricimonas rarisocia TaxID=2528026 RepID=A0A517Z2P1_9PLAN|nr:hypothetical protein [Maioricimonas rarisocia]QDU36742.1 hypothetical protein Mal4_10400 [Maioricimonas rarisocia]